MGHPLHMVHNHTANRYRIRQCHLQADQEQHHFHQEQFLLHLLPLHTPTPLLPLYNKQTVFPWWPRLPWSPRLQLWVRMTQVATASTTTTTTSTTTNTNTTS